MNTLKYWSRNSDILDNPKINPTFREVLLFSEQELKDWIDEMRSFVLKVWDEKGIPPLNGRTTEEIQEEFREMESYPVKKFQKVDQLDGLNNVILNTSSLGSCVNQFFPTMMKAKINYNTSLKGGDKFNGYSVYELFKEDRFRNRMQLGCKRHFRRDSFYRYSWSIPVADNSLGIVPATTGREWVTSFHKFPKPFSGYGYWLCPIENDRERKGSGYTEVNLDKFLSLSKKEIEELKDILSDTALANIGELKENYQYHIRLYKNDTRIFPHGFTAFKIGYIQVAVNFPPLIAKFLYEKYTEHIKNQPVINLYDPSSGWGGRIVGAMSVRDDRTIHYIGTDPNTDNLLPDIIPSKCNGKAYSRYEYVANFFNDSVVQSNLARQWMGASTHSFEVFQSGSEDIHKLETFQKYKGKLDFVFTSPPYFNREAYSDDPTQSLNKFNQYESWRDGFLKPTLTTCYEYLRPDRYLAWNIADIKVGDIYYPLEEDSKKILVELGMQFIGIEKMALANMPGANRVGKDGKPTAKNYCKVDGRWVKYEPIFIFYKPK